MIDLLNSSVHEIHNTASCFVTYLSQLQKSDGEPINYRTIDQYITHVIFYLTNKGIIDSTFDFRCPSTGRLLQAIKRRDAHVRPPLRERISIAHSLPILNECVSVAKEEFQCPHTVAFVTASLYFTYALSFRPDDTFIPVADDKNRVRGCHGSFWFLGHAKPYHIHQLHPPFVYPPSGTPPLRISVIVDYDKANITGDACIRACGANPVPGQFCFVQFLYEFYLIYPILDECTAIFGNLPSHVNTSASFLSTCVKRTLALTAIKLGLRVSQLTRRGGRAGATAQIKGSGGLKDDCKTSGGWRSKAHEKYERSDFAMADRCAAAMHNTAAVDINVVRYVHS